MISKVMKLILFVNFINIIKSQSYCQGTKNLTIAALFPITGWWPGGSALRIAAEMAIEHVNSRDDILPGYQLHMEWNNTGCIPKVGTKRLQEMISTGPTKVMFLGPSTSDVSEATAQVSYVWNVVQLSTVAVSPTLSNKNKYPWFYRVSGPELKLNPPRLAMMNAFGWDKVAILYQSIEFLIAAKNEMELRLKNNNKKILASVELLNGQTTTALTELKNTDARIIFTFLLRNAALNVFCEAYRMGLYGRKYVWILVAWYEDQWWTVQEGIHRCTVQEMLTATEGLFTVGAFYLNPMLERGIANLTSAEFMSEYLNRTGGVVLFGSKYAPQTYDGIWVISLALNATIQKLEESGSGKCLSDFKYQDHAMALMIKDSLQNLTMLGVKGYISFDSNGDPFGPLEIQRIIDNKYTYVGTFYHKNNDITWYLSIDEIFKGQKPPRDSTLIEPKLEFVSIWLYVAMCIIAGIGILLALIFLITNILCRKRRIIKMSAPNLNNLILVGCILSYTTVFFQDLAQWSTGTYCKIYIFLKSVGFALTFGALFAKTWRIHVIFANKTSIKKVISDTTLILLVMGFVGINILLLIIWNVVDDLQENLLFTGDEVFFSGEDRVEKQQVSICKSQHMAIFYGTLYAIDGLTLLFGVFLAWETRKVTIQELNDSKYIGFCIYNMLVPMVVGTGMYHLLSKEVNSQYTLTSLCQIVATTLTQCIIFAPKIMKLREQGITPVEEDKRTHITAVSSIGENRTKTGNINSDGGSNGDRNC